jgi:hypothetical protein
MFGARTRRRPSRLLKIKIVKNQYYQSKFFHQIINNINDYLDLHNHTHRRPRAPSDTRDRRAALLRSTRHRSRTCDPIRSLDSDNNTFHSCIACRKSIAPPPIFARCHSPPGPRSSVVTRSCVKCMFDRVALIQHTCRIDAPLRCRPAAPLVQHATRRRRFCLATNAPNTFSATLHSPLLESSFLARRCATHLRVRSRSSVAQSSPRCNDLVVAARRSVCVLALQRQLHLGQLFQQHLVLCLQLTFRVSDAVSRCCMPSSTSNCSSSACRSSLNRLL